MAFLLLLLLLLLLFVLEKSQSEDKEMRALKGTKEKHATRALTISFFSSSSSSSSCSSRRDSDHPFKKKIATLNRYTLQLMTISNHSSSPFTSIMYHLMNLSSTIPTHHQFENHDHPKALLSYWALFWSNICLENSLYAYHFCIHCFCYFDMYFLKIIYAPHTDEVTIMRSNGD